MFYEVVAVVKNPKGEVKIFPVMPENVDCFTHAQGKAYIEHLQKGDRDHYTEQVLAKSKKTYMLWQAWDLDAVNLLEPVV